MGAIEHLTISLPTALAERVRGKVAAEHLPDINAAIVEALSDWAEPDQGDVPLSAEEEEWVRREVIPAIRRYDEDPSRAFSADQVRAHLAEARSRREQSSC